MSSIITFRDEKPEVTCKEKVDYFLDNYGKFTTGMTIGIVVCVVLLVNIIVGLCLQIHRHEEKEGEPLYVD